MSQFNISSNDSGIRKSMFAQRQERALFEKAKNYAFRYLDDLSQRPVYPSEAAITALKAFDEPLPQEPQSSDDILQLLHTHGSPGTVAHTGGRYFGFVFW
jgi:hypothetical protein